MDTQDYKNDSMKLLVQRREDVRSAKKLMTTLYIVSLAAIIFTPIFSMYKHAGPIFVMVMMVFFCATSLISLILRIWLENMLRKLDVRILKINK